MSLVLPFRVPKLGFYYNYKHDVNKSVNNHAYEVLGVGFHTENDRREGEEYFVVYRPLYESPVYKAMNSLGVLTYDLKPLRAWLSRVVVNELLSDRYRLVSDKELIEKLNFIRNRMYP